MEIILSTVCALVIGFLAGNFRRNTIESIKELQKTIETKRDKPEVDEVKKSTLIDPLDPTQEARRQYEQQMEDLNPYE